MNRRVLAILLVAFFIAAASTYLVVRLPRAPFSRITRAMSLGEALYRIFTRVSPLLKTAWPQSVPAVDWQLPFPRA